MVIKGQYTGDLNNLLREEAFKFWEYDVTDKLVQYGDCSELHTASDDVVTYDKIIGALRGRWWEILIHHRDGNFYCVVIEPVLSHSSLKLNLRNSCAQSNDAVFVKIGELVEYPQPVVFRLYPIRCVVRLKRLNGLSGVIGNVLQKALEVQPGLTGIRQTDRERCVFIGSKLCEKCQLPSEVVKSRTQVMEDIASHDSKKDGNSGILKPIDISRLIRIEVFGNDVNRFTVIPSLDSIVERLYVFRCPIELASWPIEWVHMLYCFHSV